MFLKHFCSLCFLTLSSASLYLIMWTSALPVGITGGIIFVNILIEQHKNKCELIKCKVFREAFKTNCMKRISSAPDGNNNSKMLLDMLIAYITSVNLYWFFLLLWFLFFCGYWYTFYKYLKSRSGGGHCYDKYHVHICSSFLTVYCVPPKCQHESFKIQGKIITPLFSTLQWLSSSPIMRSKVLSVVSKALNALICH